MMRYSFLILLFFPAAWLGAQIPGQSNLFKNEAEIERLMVQNKIPALGLGVIEGGQLRQIRVYGELRDGLPAPFDALFKVASLTKPLVAVTVLKLVEQGRLSLDESLSQYWIDPDLEGDERHRLLTPGLILSHRTGFPNWRRESSLSFEFEPGSRLQYSGEGFQYLMRALEAKFDRPFHEIVRSVIFQEVGMDDSYLGQYHGIDTSRFALNHRPDGTPHELTFPAEMDAAGGLVTTVGDYGHFVAELIGGTLLGDSLFQLMVQPVVQVKQGSFMGLSWEIFPDLKNGEYALMHTGFDAGVRALVLLLPKSGRGLVILANSEEIFPIWFKVIADFLGDVGIEIIARGGE